MGSTPARARDDGSAGALVAEVDQLIAAWLDALARSGNGLLKVYGRRRLRALLRRYVSPDSLPSPDGRLTSVGSSELTAAASMLRAQAASALHSEGVRAAAAALSSALEEAAEATPGSGEAARPAETLWLASVAVESARTPAAVARAVADGALALCRARNAVWWERHDGSLQALAVAGGEVPERPLSFRPPAGFWTSHASRGGRLVTLSAEAPAHAAFLGRFGARRGVIARAHVGRRWRSALSVHDGDLSSDRVSLLLALVEQGAAAMLALGAPSWLQAAGPLAAAEPAMTSAVSLDDLLERVCGLTAQAVEGASFLFLADDADRLRLRCQAGIAEEAREMEAALGATAARTRASAEPQLVELDASALEEPSLEALRRHGLRSALGVPLVVHDRRFGALLAFSRKTRLEEANERARIQGLATRAAVEIESMELLESAQRRLTEISDLTRMGRRVVNTLDPDSIAQTVAESAAEVLVLPRAAIFIANGDGEFEPLGKGQFGLPQAGRLPATGHIGAQSLQAGAPVTVSDTTAEGRDDDPLVLWMAARSIACTPLVTSQGLRGFLAVAGDVPRAFELHAVSLLSSHANQAALALQAAVLYRQAVEQVRRLSKLSEMSEALTSSQSPTQSAGILLQCAISLFAAPVGMVWLVERASGDLVLASIHGLTSEEWAMERVESGEGLAGLAAQSGRPLISIDITRDGRFPYRQQAREMGLGPAIAAPLISQGRTLGVLSVYRRPPGKFTEEDRRLIMSIANNAAIALENSHLLEEAQRRADFVAAMMSEVNYRMRSSLQAVAGLLRMELERPRVRSVEDTVRRALSHVQAVAAVHEVVREPDVYLVDVKEVALRVAKLPRTVRDRRTEVQVSGTRVMLPSQRAINVALVLNELVDNAVQHGVSGAEGGRISISLAEGGGEVVIQVRNTGAGAPKDFSIETSPGLGLKIVRGLVEQELGGRVEVETKNAFVVRVRFPKTL